MPTTVDAVTADVAIANVAEVAPPATDTLAGTPTTFVFALESSTETPAPAAGPLRDTVPVDGWPPCTVEGLTPTEVSDAATVPGPGFQPSWTTSKSRGGQGGEGRVQDAVVPAGVEGAADVHVRAVVGDDQPVRLHGAEDLLHLGSEPRDVLARLQAKAGAHGQRALRAPRGVRRRVHVAVGRAHRHAEGVLDVGDGGVVRLVVADQAGKDGEARGVRGRPSLGTPVVGLHVPEGAAARLPAPAVGVVVHGVELVEVLVVPVDDDQVAVLAVALVHVAGRPPSTQCGWVMA